MVPAVMTLVPLQPRYRQLAKTLVSFRRSACAAAATAAPATPEPPGHETVGVLSGASDIPGRVAEIHAAAADVPSWILTAGSWLAQAQHQQLIAAAALLVAAMLAGGLALEVLARGLLRRAGMREGSVRKPEDRAGPLARLFMRLSVDLFTIVAFAAGAAGALLLVSDRDEVAVQWLLAALAGVVVLRLVAAAGRVLFSPQDAGIRLLPLDDDAALLLYRQLIILAALLVVFRLVHELANVEEPGLLGLLALTMIWLFAVALSWALWRCRGLIARYFGSCSSDLGAADAGAGIATRLPAIAIGYVIVAALAASTLKLATGRTVATPFLASFVVLLFIPLADWVVRLGARSLVGRLSHRPPTGESPPQALVDGRRAYERVLVRNARVLLAVGAVLMMAMVWSVDVGTVAERGLGARIAGSLFDIIVTLTLASALWGLVRTALRQGVVQAEAEAGGEGGSAGAASRLQTLLPLFGKALLAAITVIAALLVLSSLGVNIAPLIAGAGVVGIALGFGAQTLVRDMLSGVFLLLEDAFRVGEYVDVGSAKGTVENISLRYLRLRHHLGQINTIPFGEIRTLTNFSRDWAIMKLELRVPYAADLEKVRKIVKSVGQELLTHPEFGRSFLQPLKSRGVHRMDDSAFIIRVKFMAKPGEQFVLRREVFRRIQQAFAAEGIEFAPRRVIVDGAAKEAAAAAAMADEAGVRPTGAAPAA